jgi:hypothetical protein
LLPSRVSSGETAGLPGTSSRPWPGFSVTDPGFPSFARLLPLVQPYPQPRRKVRMTAAPFQEPWVIMAGLRRD